MHDPKLPNMQSVLLLTVSYPRSQDNPLVSCQLLPGWPCPAAAILVQASLGYHSNANTYGGVGLWNERMPLHLPTRLPVCTPLSIPHLTPTPSLTTLPRAPILVCKPHALPSSFAGHTPTHPSRCTTPMGPRHHLSPHGPHPLAHPFTCPPAHTGHPRSHGGPFRTVTPCPRSSCSTSHTRCL